MQYLNLQSVFLSKIPCGIAIVFLFFSVFPIETLIAQNPTISIQGTLKNSQGEVVEDGSYPVTFKLYHEATGGGPVWEEETSVVVTGGVYSHMLGSEVDLVPAVFNDPVWLGVVIEGFELSPRTAFSYSPYSFSVEFAQKVICSGAVGDVKHSILDPDQFAAVNGDCWVPMDGREMDPDDELRQITGLTHVPQGGGMFLRAQDFENSNNDPDREHTTDIATVQEDDIKSHNHEMEEAGNHSHDLPNIAWKHFRSFEGKDGPDSPLKHTNTSSSDEIWLNETEQAGAHTHPILSTGGDETRPKNLNFWIYIRIN